MTRTWTFTALLLLAIGASACSRMEVSPSGDTDAAAPVDPRLLAFLSKARSAHHRADLLEEGSDLAPAIATLAEVVDEANPGTTYIEVREVLADTHARLADLESRAKNLTKAEAQLERGLSHAREPTYFRGHLFEVRGLVEERRAKILTEKGDEIGASKAKQAALDAFEESMNIQQRVIEQLLPEADR